jgi:hypothetical protein
MKFRNITENGDWTFGSGLSNYTTENQAIGLNIKTRILSWLNDCFFDMTAGVDWYNRIGNKSQDNLLELDLRRIILQSEGVTGIVDFTITNIERAFKASFTIDTIYSKSYTDSIIIGV